VERGQEEVPVVFTPRTVPFYPAQLYETISMLVLIGLLLSFQPYRRHDGQVMVLFLLGYAVHRFFNESIRIEPTYAMGLTLSQWISLLIVVLAIGLEVMLRLTLPRRGTASATLTD
jgi:prolipoprotein diacylglyceryltransferase